MQFSVPCECGSRRFSFGVQIHGEHKSQRIVKCAHCGSLEKGAVVDWITIRPIEQDYPDIAQYDDIRVYEPED